MEAGFYSDVVECLPLDPAAQVPFPPRAVRLPICDQGLVGVAHFCAKWGIKLVQATLIPLARSYFPLNCEQADRQIFGLSVKSGLIIGHRNTSLLMSIS